MEVELAPFQINKVFVNVFGCVLPANLIEVDLGSLLRAIFVKKCLILKFLAKILAKKKINENSQQIFVGSQIKINIIIVNSFYILY